MKPFEEPYKLEMPVGDCIIPSNLNELPVLTAAKNFICTNALDYCNFYLPTKNQGSTPMCAAYSCSSFVESILWRKNNYPQSINPNKIYEYAKTIDGMNGGGGTTLTAIAEAIYHYNLLDGTKDNIRVISAANNYLQDLKFALFKYGGCLIGMNITDEYYVRRNTGPTADIIFGYDKYKSIGGHAMVLVGFNDDISITDENNVVHKGMFIVLNSWGREWGDNGYCYIPYDIFIKQFLYAVVFKNCLNNID